jgi:transposase-like protein
VAQVGLEVRDGQVRNKPIYVVIGVTVNGERAILGLWAGDGSEGAKFWLQVLSELKNRGVADVCIAVCDGLKGLPDAINAVWELTTAGLHHPPDPQHLPLGLAEVLGSDRPRPAAGLYRRYRSRGQGRFEEFAEKWGKPYPAIKRLRENAPRPRRGPGPPRAGKPYPAIKALWTNAGANSYRSGDKTAALAAARGRECNPA